MILLIHGPTHTGKTYVAQKVLESFKYPYLSIDHLKMGLIRSKHTHLTPSDSISDLTHEIWPILKEIIKTAIENDQNLVIEGCYIPFDFTKDFEPKYLKHISYVCLLFHDTYIHNHYRDIIRHQSIVEKRISVDLTVENLIKENNYYSHQVNMHALNHFIIKDFYGVDEILKKIKDDIAL
jgi:hypothetical protein